MMMMMMHWMQPARVDVDAGDDDAALVEELALGQRMPAEIAARHGLSLAQLAQRMQQAHNAATLEAILYLTDLHAQLLLSHYRFSAAARLVSLTSEEQSPEMSRRASVDLLKAQVPTLKALSRLSSVDGPALAPDEAAILRALDELGERFDDDDE